MVGLVTGALASADTPAASDALALLLQDPLPDAARQQILGELALSRAPTEGSAGALAQALDQPSGARAALALGAQAQKLGDDCQGSVDTLLQRYAAATTPGDQRLYLEGLGNTGSPGVLSAMEATLAGSDYGLAQVAAFGLRLIPGDDVDDLLNGLIESGSSVAVEAIMATGYRSAELWKPRLQADRALFQGQQRVLDAIESVLGRWNVPG